ncbi:hypothetical protein EQ500_03290 [Lactobacillus sp. XV13L]|nr:hypothetical protein [Lactobacillus sp. XV13L]
MRFSSYVALAADVNPQLINRIKDIATILILLLCVVLLVYTQRHKAEVYGQPRLYSKFYERALMAFIILLPWAGLFWYFIFPLAASPAVYVKRVVDVWFLIVLCVVWTAILLLVYRHDLKMRKKYGGD